MNPHTLSEYEKKAREAMQALGVSFAVKEDFDLAVKQCAKALQEAVEAERERIVAKLEVIDPLRVSADWEDSDDIACSVHKYCIAAIRATTKGEK